MKIFYFCILFVLFYDISFSQENIKSNYEIMDSISNDCVKSLTTHIIKNKDLKSFHLEIVDLINNGSNKLFENKIIKALPDNNILSQKDSAHNIISFRIEDFSVKYEIYEPNTDSLYRKITLSAISLLDNGKTKTKISECNYEYRELVSRDNLVFIERTPHVFAKSPIPERNRTFFESILQPAIYVSAALITVIILFTVRSN